MNIPEGRLVLRQCDENMFRQLPRLFRQCYPHEDWTEEDFVKFMRKKKGGVNCLKVLTCASNDTLYGAILFTLRDKSCRLRRVAVPKPFRKRGYGTCMVNGLTSYRSRIVCDKFLAKVRERELLALQFMRSKRLGFIFDPAAPRVKDKNGDDFYLFVHERPVRTQVTSHAGSHAHD